MIMIRNIVFTVALVLLIGCGGGALTNDSVYRSLVGYAKTDRDFLNYSAGRTIGGVTGIVNLDENRVQIMFTIVNPPCDRCEPTSAGRATAVRTTEGAWLLDCMEYPDVFGNIFMGHQACGVNRTMQELASFAD
jgi:hypothetical protein